MEQATYELGGDVLIHGDVTFNLSPQATDACESALCSPNCVLVEQTWLSNDQAASKRTFTSPSLLAEAVVGAYSPPDGWVLDPSRDMERR